VGTKPISGVLADFNDDGSLDLAVVENPQYTVSVLLGDGHGSFATAISYDCGNDPENIIALDDDRDGIIDLIVNNHQSKTITVLPGLGDGSFGAGISYDAGSGPGMMTGDFNGDCFIDLAVVNDDSGQLMVLPGTALGTFGTAITQPVITKLNFIVGSDFNNDLRPDLAVANTLESSLYVFLGSAQYACGNSFIRRATNPASVKNAPIHTSTNQTPFDDQNGSLNDGVSYYYSVEHEAALPLKLSVHKNSYAQTVRLGFNDGNPLSAPVDPSLSTVSVDRTSVPADGVSTATVTIVPRDSHSTQIGSGCLPVIDENLLAPAIIVGAIRDNSNGSYSFKVSSSIPGTARVSVTVEGIALSTQPVINFTP
jgi:hypothetical protein